MDRAISQNFGEQEAFIAAASLRADSWVLDLGWEGDWLHPLCDQRLKAHWFLSDDIRAVRRSGAAQSIHADDLTAIDKRFDAIFYRPAQRSAKEQVFSWIDGAFQRLKPGGSLVLAGRRDRGVDSYAARTQAVFGNIEKRAQKAKTRIFRAIRSSAQPGAEPAEIHFSFPEPDLPGGPFFFKTRAGVFSRDGVDPGSRLLLEKVDVHPDAQVLDLGCGYGVLGMACARLAPRGVVRMVDVSFRAVRCTRENINENRIQNATVQVSDGFETIGQAKFDLILSNPPFHEGNAVGHAFIDGAFSRLSPGGRFFLVVMRPVPYCRRIKKVFGSVEVVARRDGYEVLLASRLPR